MSEALVVGGFLGGRSLLGNVGRTFQNLVDANSVEVLTMADASQVDLSERTIGRIVLTHSAGLMLLNEYNMEELHVIAPTAMHHVTDYAQPILRKTAKIAQSYVDRPGKRGGARCRTSISEVSEFVRHPVYYTRVLPKILKFDAVTKIKDIQREQVPLHIGIMKRDKMGLKQDGLPGGDYGVVELDGTHGDICVYPERILAEYFSSIG